MMVHVKLHASIGLLHLILLSLLLLGTRAQVYTAWNDSTAGQREMRNAVRYNMPGGTIEVVQHTYYCDYTATSVNGIGYDQISDIADVSELHKVCAKWCDALNSANATPTCTDPVDGKDAGGAACALNADKTACANSTGGCTYTQNKLRPGRISHCYGYWADVGTVGIGYCGFYTANITNTAKLYNNPRKGTVSAVCTTDAHNIRNAYCNYIGTRDTNNRNDFCSEAGANGLIENPDAQACAGVRCNKTIDALTCCAADAKCDSVLKSGHGGGDFFDICELHTNGSAIWPGSDSTPRGANVQPLLVANASNVSCGSSKCQSSDAGTCCQKRASCTSIISDVEVFCAGGGLKSDAADKQCTTTTCQRDSRNVFDPNSQTDQKICCNEPATTTTTTTTTTPATTTNPPSSGSTTKTSRSTTNRPVGSAGSAQTLLLSGVVFATVAVLLLVL